MAATTIVPLPLEALEASKLAPNAKEPNVQVSIVLDEANDEAKNFLVVSPYEEPPHLLDLRTLDTNNQLLAKALVGLKCLRDDYATAEYVDIFNWPEVVENVKQLAAEADYHWQKESFFIVVFRSQLDRNTVYADLGLLDKAAHAEATESGGFLKYWFGSPDKAGRNLATCVWRNPGDARIGSLGAAHRRAANATRMLYTEWRIERLRFTIQDGATDWEISNWD